MRVLKLFDRCLRTRTEVAVCVQYVAPCVCVTQFREVALQGCHVTAFTSFLEQRLRALLMGDVRMPLTLLPAAQFGERLQLRIVEDLRIAPVILQVLFQTGQAP